jgi:general secretion pathway protein K
VRDARAALDRTQARWTASGAIRGALVAITQAEPVPIWTWRPIAVGAERAMFRMEPEAGKVDVNLAGVEALEALFQAAGAARADAEVLARRLIDYRDPDHRPERAGAEDLEYRHGRLDYGAKDAALRSVTEVHNVLGVPRALSARLPALATVQGGVTPAPALAATALRSFLPAPLQSSAAAQSPGSIAPATAHVLPDGVYTVRARAERGAARSVIAAIVAFPRQQPPRILQWHELADAP